MLNRTPPSPRLQMESLEEIIVLIRNHLLENKSVEHNLARFRLIYALWNVYTAFPLAFYPLSQHRSPSDL